MAVTTKCMPLQRSRLHVSLDRRIVRFRRKSGLKAVQYFTGVADTLQLILVCQVLLYRYNHCQWTVQWWFLRFAGHRTTAAALGTRHPIRQPLDGSPHPSEQRHHEGTICRMPIVQARHLFTRTLGTVHTPIKAGMCMRQTPIRLNY